MESILLGWPAIISLSVGKCYLLSADTQECNVIRCNFITIRKLEAFHMRCKRTILGIRWYDFVRKTEVLAATNLPCIHDIITRRRKSLFDHVVRLNVRKPAHRALSQAATARAGSSPAAPRSSSLLVDTADRRRYILRYSCRMIQGSPSAVMDTPGWRNGSLLSTWSDRWRRRWWWHAANDNFVFQQDCASARHNSPATAQNFWLFSGAVALDSPDLNPVD